MSLVVSISGSLYSTYISTVDHLPCDIVRSLWLVQSCNLAVEKEEERLNKLFLEYGNETQKQAAGQYVQLRQKIEALSRESVEEMEALYNQLQAHESMLKSEVLQLQKVAEAPVTKDESSTQSLRKQLEEHYKQNPLPSQVEVRQRQKDVKRLNEPSGIRLILKLSKHDEPRVIRKRGRPRKSESPELRRIPRGVSDIKLPPKIAIKPPSRKPVPVIEPTPEPVVESQPEETYCFCHQPSFGDMIACDNEKCPNGEWFHYKCVNLLNRVDALKYTTQKWYCSDACREAGQAALERKKKQRKRKRNW